jgi:alkylation response protein AidB-like acyl-CoA dehydrogenase
VDLELSDEQIMLRDAVRAMCERHSSIEVVRALEGDPKGFSDDLWRALSKMGLLDLPRDGLFVEMAVACEEFGRALTPSPYFESAIFARSDEITTLAWHEAERTEDGITTTFTGGRVTGEKILVPFASASSRMLVVARDGDEIVVASVDPSDAALTFEGTLASDARYRVVFEEAPGEAVLRGWDPFLDACTPVLVGVASYAVGGAQRAHEISVEYAKERIQFDKPIGAFQAISHPLADTATEIAGARTLVHQAAWALSEGRSTAKALAAMAKYAACDVFRRTTKLGHQVFGGIGFTLDIDIQLFLRRAKQLEVLWFGPRRLEEMIAAAELDAEPPLITGDAVASGASA